MIKLSTFVCQFLVAGLVLAQTSTSELSGTVRDPGGAVVPGARVTLTNEATGITYQQSTTGAGLYNFPALPVGSYTVTVEAPGFKTAKLTKNTVVVNTPLSLDVALEVGQFSEVVSVEIQTETLQTTNATIEIDLTEHKIPAGTQSSRSFRLKGMGVPVVHSSARGDEHIIVKVVTPTSLTAEQKRLLEEFARLEREQSEQNDKNIFRNLFEKTKDVFQ